MKFNLRDDDYQNIEMNCIRVKPQALSNIKKGDIVEIVYLDNDFEKKYEIENIYKDWIYMRPAK